MLQQISIADIDISGRKRLDFGDLEEMAESLKAQGLIQPITVRKIEEGTYKLLAGGRRLEAAKLLGWTTIDAIQKETKDDLEDMEIELIENLHRKDFNWFERISAIWTLNENLKQKHKGVNKQGVPAGWSLRSTAKLLGKSHGGVHRQLQLYESIHSLPDELQVPIKACENEDQAVKMVRSVMEEVTLMRALVGQKETLEDDEEEWDESEEEGESEEEKAKRMKARALRTADSNYRVGDAFAGLKEMIAFKKEKGAAPPIYLCEVDPPYGIDLLRKKKGEGKSRLDYNEIPTDEYNQFLVTLCDLMYEALPDECHIVFWYGHEWYSEVTGALSQAGFLVDSIPCIWTKKSGQTNNPERYLARAYEPFIYARKGEPMLFKRGRSNVFEFPVVPHTAKIHPTQRPLALITEILETFTYPRAIVLSPFLGSGATLLACYDTERLGFGWDLAEGNKERFMLQVEKWCDDRESIEKSGTSLDEEDNSLGEEAEDGPNRAG